MNVRRVIRGVTAAFGGLLALVCVTLPCRAQTEGDTPSSESGAEANVPPELKPYTAWHAHSGTAPECVARIQVEARGDEPELTMSGLVARCDGFLLVPRAAYDRLRVRGAKGTVSVIAAENETISAPINVGGWELATPVGRKPEYGLIKVNDHHLKCLPLLSGDVVKPGMTVHVVFAVDSAKPGLCTPRSYTATVSPAIAEAGHTSTSPEHFRLTNVSPLTDERPKNQAGRAAQPSPASVSATDTPTEIPVGAVVVDVESDAAIGMVTQAGDAPTFQTMAQFERLFSDVPVLPSRTALASRRETTRNRSDGMILVPGGAVLLQGQAAKDYDERFHTHVACMPDFCIDVLPVTNGQYRNWMMEAGRGTTFPAAWSDTEVDNPVHRQDLPVLGVAAKSALQYAQCADKRLVTDVEWQRASRVERDDWYQALIGDRADTFQEALYELKGLLRLTSEQQAWLAHHQANRSRGTAQAPAAADQAAQADYLAHLASDMTSNGWMPGQPHPVGYYLQDVSLFGVRDVVTNPVESLMPRADAVTIGAKWHPAKADPYVSYVRYQRGGSVGAQQEFRYFIELSPAESIFYYDAIWASYTGGGIHAYGAREMSSVTTPEISTVTTGGGSLTHVRRGGIPANRADTSATIASSTMNYEVAPVVYPEFRCAR